jgi:hypothetical protein
MSHTPLNLDARDFDAYAAEKATSNAYSRPRLELKQRALAWARGVVARLADLGIAVDVHGSDEHPTLRNKKRVDCQWVFFWRDPAAREELDRLLDRGRSIAAEIDDPSPYQRHAFLALRLDVAGVEVCFAVHPEARVDLDNLRARLAPDLAHDEGAAADELVRALHALPEQFTLALGVASGDGPPEKLAVGSVTIGDLRALLDRAEETHEPLWIGWSVGREAAIEHSALVAGDAPGRPPTVDEQLEDAIVALAPIYRLVAWSRDNDRITLDRRIETIGEERARAHAAAEAETERWRAEQAEARARSAELARERAAAGQPIAAPRSDRPPRRPSLETLFGARPSAPSRVLAVQPSAGTLGSAPKPTSRSPQGPHAPNAGATPTARARDSSPPASAPRAPAAARDRRAHEGKTHEAALHEGAPLEGPMHEGAMQEGARFEAAPSTSLPTPAGAPQAAHTPAAAAPLEKGCKVRVRSGPFADKVGIVGELDGRGGARVLLGLLATRLEVSELEAVVEGRERPPLQSSHRRPLPPPPRKARG